MPFVTTEVQPIVEEIATILKSRNQTIAVSEAACGGILSAYLVAVAGASKFFQGGTLVYSLKSKLKLSGWSESEILSYTGPSKKSVLKQARNLRMELGSTYVLCESGFAGPSVDVEGVTSSPNAKKQKIENKDNTNGEEETLLDDSRKVGTVYFAISGPNGEETTVENTGLSDRVENMEEFAKLGLEFFLQVLKNADK
ncbi:hypothetical protein DASC09_032920 [Saccharomycopsis crataegensis]|uniref:CinA C-terminal domain-containing protein n=1 Tax=Saccharomycopsis crataegensis TaxID=43959 RepID=A0AAV5QME2_9ASCO|nr:hypothetical protein DASC09_032920 [Saccharomycopsis crataegensis]